MPNKIPLTTARLTTTRPHEDALRLGGGRAPHDRALQASREAGSSDVARRSDPKGAGQGPPPAAGRPGRAAAARDARRPRSLLGSNRRGSNRKCTRSLAPLARQMPL